jgi:diguanylate cyclase (GGDEF)-like protein
MDVPSQQTLLVVIFVAIVANLFLAIGLLIGPRLGDRGRPRSLAVDAAIGPGIAAMSNGANRNGRSLLGLLGPPEATPPPMDPETGFDLSPVWARWLEEEEARVRRYRRSATVVIVEVEGLDRLVERFGAEAAGRLIPPVATTMRRHARETDRLARLGAVRFGALLPETDEISAINYVERIRTACDTWLEAGGVAARLAIGWAEANSGRTMDAALLSAEDRLNADRRHERLTSDNGAGAEDGVSETEPADAEA